MVVSVNPDPHRYEFDSLLKSTVLELNAHAKKTSSGIAKLSGINLEPYVCDIMSELAKGTPFENSIKVEGGQKFPDIVANRFYGIEVKTTTKDHWKTTGNSVMETTRVKDVERIFMLFAKLAGAVEFRYRPYEEVLSEVVVTHSPRYLIDMNLNPGDTIFDKMNLPYDDLRKHKNPAKPIVDYYKTKLKAGEELWWMDANSSGSANSLIIKIWNNLPHADRKNLLNKGMAYFPELFTKRLDKFSRFAMWLVTKQSVVCPNIRDPFTAGGTKDYYFDGNVYSKLPRILLNLLNNLDGIKQVIVDTPADELSNFWGIVTTEKTKLSDWTEIVSRNARLLTKPSGLNVQRILQNLV